MTPRPSYQDDAVNSYLKNSSGTVPAESYFNTKGRAYADAVTVGHNLEVVLDSEIVAIGMLISNDIMMNGGWRLTALVCW